MKNWQRDLPVADILPDLPDLSSRFLWARKHILRSSQTWVAKEASELSKITISQQYVAAIESGSSRHPKHLNVLATVLGVPLDWLYEGRRADGPQPISVGVHQLLDRDLVHVRDTIIDFRLWGKDIPGNQTPWILEVSSLLLQKPFHIGDMLVIRRGQDPKPGEYVVFRGPWGYGIRQVVMAKEIRLQKLEYVDDLGIQPAISQVEVDTLGIVCGMFRSHCGTPLPEM